MGYSSLLNLFCYEHNLVLAVSQNLQTPPYHVAIYDSLNALVHLINVLKSQRHHYPIRIPDNGDSMAI